MPEATKKCIFCAETIKAEARLCRFCNREQVDPREKSAEVVFYEGAVLHRTFIGEHLLYGLVMLIGLGLVVYDLWSDTSNTGALDGLLWKLGALLMMVGAGASLVRVIKTSSLRWKITDQRVQTERGIFSKQVEVLQLWRIEDMEYSQSLLQRLLNEATIKLMTSDRTSPTLFITGISNHRALYEKLRQAIEKRRRENRVMTVEQHPHPS